MEDALGYGEVNFSSYPQSFLSGYANGLNAALPNISDGTGTAPQRGAAQTFFYYLVSQKGGVTFSPALSGGGGLDFIRNFVSGSKNNIEGITAAYGGDWVTTMGNYLGALAIDGASTVVEPAVLKVQAPKSDIINTIGQDKKVFGMRFHRHGAIGDLEAMLGNFTPVTATDTDVDVFHYTTQPLVYTQKSTSDVVTVTLAQIYANSAVSVVRFK